MRSPGSAIFQLYFTDEARHINNGTIAAVSQTSQNPSRPSHPSDHDCRPDHRGFTSHPILLIVAVTTAVAPAVSATPVTQTSYSSGGPGCLMTNYICCN